MLLSVFASTYNNVGRDSVFSRHLLGATPPPSVEFPPNDRPKLSQVNTFQIQEDFLCCAFYTACAVLNEFVQV